jgi:uncharacterized membrane protein
VGLSLRSGMLTTAILAQIGAYLTPLLVSTGRNEQVMLMTYLVVLAAGFLGVAAWMRWQWLAVLAGTGTIILFGRWYQDYYGPEAYVSTCAFAWALFAVFALYATLATARGRAYPQVGSILLSAAAAALVALWAAMPDASAAEALGQLLALDALVLGVCLLRPRPWQRWHWPRAGAVGWTVIGFVFAMRGPWPADGDVFYSLWCWAFLALFLADILLRAWWQESRTLDRLDAALATAAVALVFWGTHRLLDVDYHAWMGLYGLGLSAGTIGLFLALPRRPDRRLVRYAFLGQGLVLLTVAGAIQFDYATLTLVWAAQAAATALVAARLDSRVLVAKSPAVLLLAMGHFFCVDLVKDQRMSSVAWTVGGVDIRNALLVAIALTAAALLVAAILRLGGKPFAGYGFPVAMLAAWTGIAVWVIMTCAELPANAATWWWLALSGGLMAAAVARRAGWLMATAGALLPLAAAKFILADTLVWTAISGVQTDKAVALNWQFSAALAGAALTWAFGRLLRRWDGSAGMRPLQAASYLLAAVLVVWAGTFEVQRYFAAAGARYADVALATQMGYSIWWSACAAWLLALGLAAGRAGPRYLALALFAMTLVKVFLVDMAKVELGYRIVSFLVLGALMVAASLLYHRHFRGKAEKAGHGPTG